MRTHRHFICAEYNYPRIRAAMYYLTHIKTAAIHTYARWLMLVAKRNEMRMADRLLSVGHVTGATKGSFKVWQSLISNMPKGINEIYCHPGYPDETLYKYANYVKERIKEREILVSTRFQKLLTDNEVKLIGFNSI
jgi:predicted glycoside hydrolase/deacetylase ChbG (UPF0249 family)